MKKLSSVAIALLGLIGLSGCADFTQQRCTENAAFDQGRSDRSSGKRMDENYALLCPSGDGNFMNSLNRAYRRGYFEGVRPHNIYPSNRGGINPNSQGGGIGSGAYPNNSGGGIGSGAYPNNSGGGIGSGAYPNNSGGGIGSGAYPNNSGGGIGTGAYYGVPPAGYGAPPANSPYLQRQLRNQ